MEAKGLEPLTLGLQSRCSSQLSYAPELTNGKREKMQRAHAGSFTLRKTSSLLPQDVSPLAPFLLERR